MANRTPKLRVLQLCHDYEGPFRSVCYQYNHAFSDQDVTTVYVCGDASDQVIRDTGGNRVFFLGQSTSSQRGIKFATIFKLARLFREYRFDVVVAHRYKPIYYAGVLSYFFPIKVLLAVAHEHNVFRRPTRKLFITFWCRNITCIGVSETVSRNIEQYCGNLSSKGRLYTLPHAVDLSRGSNVMSSCDARDALGLPVGSFLFGTVGRLVDKKDHDVLINAFALFLTRSTGSNARLVIIGAGPREQALRRRCEALGIEDEVSFTGHVNDAYQYLAALDVFVLPSGSMEAFGMVLLEAMLARRPVISSDAPGPREVIDEAGLLFETGNAESLVEQMTKAISLSSADRAALGQRGYERLAAHYSMPAFDQRLRALPPITAVLESPPSSKGSP